MDYLRYYFPVLLQLIGIAGILMGGGWVWVGVAELPLLALIDGFLDYDGRERPAASGFVCFFAAAVPPIWTRFILQPHLRHWDLHYATPAERELARTANRRAGWPDWFVDAPSPSGLATAAQAH